MGAPTRVPEFASFTPTTAELVQSTASTFGDQTLVVRDAERMSYRELDERSAQLAAALLASGVGKGSRVGLLAPNSAEWIVAFFAVTRIGGIAVLLNTYNKAEELRAVLRHADIQILLTVDSHLGHDYLDRLESAIPGLTDQPHERILAASHPFLRTVWTWGTRSRSWSGSCDELLARSAVVPDSVRRAAEAQVVPADPLMVIYTSGSTSAPKGVVHAHGASVRHAHNLGMLRTLGPEEVLYSPMPLFWIGGVSYTLLGAMMFGATLVFQDQFEPAATLDLIEREGVTQIFGWPHLAKALVEHSSFAGRNLSSLGGSSRALLAPASAGDEPIVSSLGMTETLGPHTYGQPDEPLPATSTFGQPIAGLEHVVVDPLTGERLADGSVGEICVRGYSLMLGLYKVERADAFTPDGWYRTGDGGRFDDDGHLHFLGRLGDVIKTSGMNVSPRDVELALEAVPGVTMAFVTDSPHRERGQDVIAAVILEPGTTIAPEDLRATVKGSVASYKVPRHITVLTGPSDLPLLDSGKVDRRRLTTMLRDRYERDRNEDA